MDQGNNHFDVVARHYHLYAFRQFDGASHVSSTEVELRTVAFEERSMTAAFVFGQDVHFRFELGVRVDGARLSQYLTTFDFFTFDTTQQNTYVLTSTAFVQQFAEHFNASTGGFRGFFDTNDFNFFTYFDDTALYTTGNNGTTTRDGEYVFDRQQERLVNRTLWFRDIGIQVASQFDDFRFPLCVAFQRFQSRTTNDRGVVAREIVLRQQFTNFHLNQFQQLFVINHVAFVQEHDDVRNAYLTTQQDVLTSLRHRAVSRSNNQDRAVHLRSTGDHVFNIVGVARAVYVRVVASRGVIFNVRGVDGDTTSFFFRRVIDLVECASRTTVGFSQNGSDGSSQGSFTMVNVADSTNVDVRFCTFKFFFRHGYIPYYSALPFGESTGLRF
ncbi:Uncharacterised protein [Klebsiella pneumoniae]|nr:Uncharacterised protein [Klebsiella pneumoniae]SJN06853.1 hypothetical protein STCB_4130 [Klebsiella pneumoniae]